MASAPVVHAASVSGDALEVRSDVQHPNGNVYDQVLLTGTSATISADAGQVARISFIDLNDDIVQVEFSGRGALTIALEDASGPATPVKYNQPDVQYMRGHVSLVISGSDATTNLSVFTVGKTNALNSALFLAGVNYDGIADLARLEIQADPVTGVSTFGAIRMGDVQFFATTGTTGIFADGVSVQGPVTVGDIAAYGNATPFLWFGNHSGFGSLSIAGGDLSQPNGRAIQTTGFQNIVMRAGTTSAGTYLPVQTVVGRVDRNGVDVTRNSVLYLASDLPASVASAVAAIVAASQAMGSVPVSGSPATTVVATPITTVQPSDPGIVVTPSG